MRETLLPNHACKGARFLYRNRLGGAVLRILISRPVSRFAGAFLSCALSRPFIGRAVKRHGIDLGDYLPEKYRCFNDFFTRRIRPELRPVSGEENALVSPCDGYLTVFPVTEEGTFRVKGFDYSVETLLKNRELASGYLGGWCFIFYLAVGGYHRYGFPADGTCAGGGTFIGGRLHTVQPVALEHRRIFTENCREYSVLDTERFGRIAQVEVGAMMVGKIVNEGKQRFARGEEKGYFEFGGSTVILLTEPGRALPDRDLLENSANRLATAVKYGERVAIGV